jgi:Holliday junction DNA helicase RuvB
MAGLLAGIKANDVVFLDEIHAIPRPVEEVLYSAMEDFTLCVEDQGFGRMMKGLGVAAKGGSGRTAKAIPPFTLLGATTILGSVTAPLRSRFAAVVPLRPYTQEESKAIAQRAAGKLGLEMPDDVAVMVAARCKGTARIAVSLVTWLRDYATATGSRLDSSLAEQAFVLKGVDADGLTASDPRLPPAALVLRRPGGPGDLGGRAG